VDHRAVAVVDLLVARCYSAKLLELAEEVVDQMPPFVHLEVAIEGLLSRGFWRSDGDGAPVVELGAQPIVVKGLVGEQSAERDIQNQRFDANAVEALTGHENEARGGAAKLRWASSKGRQPLEFIAGDLQRLDDQFAVTRFPRSRIIDFQ
jgi:hypothetical protein